MAKAGSFDRDLVPAGWFDLESTADGWFDVNLLGVSVSGNDSVLTSSQAQTAAGSFTLTVDCSVTSSQGQTSSLTTALNLSSTLSSSQAQTASAAFDRFLSGLLTTSQAQTAQGELAQDGVVNCTISSSQGQTAACEAVVPVINRGGTRRKPRKQPDWLRKLLASFEEDESVENLIAEIKEKPVEVLEEVKESVEYTDVDIIKIYKVILEIEKIKYKKLSRQRREEEILLLL
jgi:hypothetical protein